jgi:hypothetical protein
VSKASSLLLQQQPGGVERGVQEEHKQRRGAGQVRRLCGSKASSPLQQQQPGRVDGEDWECRETQLQAALNELMYVDRGIVNSVWGG